MTQSPAAARPHIISNSFRRYYMEAQKLKELKKFSAQLRIDQLQMFRQRGMGHIGGCLSVTELISVL